MTRVKVCGNTNQQDVVLALELGVDLLGFIFTRSKRRISLEAGKALTSDIPASVERVGVFIDEPPSSIAQAVEVCRLSAVQIYRPITAEDRRLGVALLPAIRIGKEQPIEANGYQPADRLLLDTYRPDTAGGGTGEVWEWQTAADLARRHPIVVSGGLDPQNVAQAIRQLAPWGVDVCSGVEAEPGKKDPVRLRAFVEAVRAADQD